jgi:hypothetical protein
MLLSYLWSKDHLLIPEGLMGVENCLREVLRIYRDQWVNVDIWLPSKRLDLDPEVFRGICDDVRVAKSVPEANVVVAFRARKALKIDNLLNAD